MRKPQFPEEAFWTWIGVLLLGIIDVILALWSLTMAKFAALDSGVTLSYTILFGYIGLCLSLAVVVMSTTALIVLPLGHAIRVFRFQRQRRNAPRVWQGRYFTPPLVRQ